MILSGRTDKEKAEKIESIVVLDKYCDIVTANTRTPHLKAMLKKQYYSHRVGKKKFANGFIIIRDYSRGIQFNLLGPVSNTNIRELWPPFKGTQA
jgi:hypothetical protein